MSTAVRTDAVDGGTLIQRFSSDGRDLCWHEVIDRWIDDGAFREVYARAIAESPFEALFWECAPLDPETLDETFEHALVPSQRLAHVIPDAKTFAAQFTDSPIVTFPNLGRDATLVVPAPLADESCYPHLSKFLREGPPAQRSSLFEHVGRALRAAETRPIWVSTSGLGVHWVHVRLDVRPKYYMHPPFRIAS